MSSSGEKHHFLAFLVIPWFVYNILTLLLVIGKVYLWNKVSVFLILPYFNFVLDLNGFVISRLLKVLPSPAFCDKKLSGILCFNGHSCEDMYKNWTLFSSQLELMKKSSSFRLYPGARDVFSRMSFLLVRKNYRDICI